MRQKKICSILPEKLGQKTITIAEDYLYNKISYAQMSQKYNCSVGCIQYHVKKYLYAHPELNCDKKGQGINHWSFLIFAKLLFYMLYNKRYLPAFSDHIQTNH